MPVYLLENDENCSLPFTSSVGFAVVITLTCCCGDESGALTGESNHSRWAREQGDKEGIPAGATSAECLCPLGRGGAALLGNRCWRQQWF